MPDMQVSRRGLSSPPRPRAQPWESSAAASQAQCQGTDVEHPGSIVLPLQDRQYRGHRGVGRPAADRPGHALVPRPDGWPSSTLCSASTFCRPTTSCSIRIAW